MPGIQSDSEFKQALSSLSLEQQRQVGKGFVESVIDLADAPKIARELASIGGSEADLEASFQRLKSVAIESYTLCGREADWLKQAGHFVAAAAAGCLTPADQQCGELAWSVAMNARMARVCEAVSRGESGDDTEARKQYEILERLINS